MNSAQARQPQPPRRAGRGAAGGTGARPSTTTGPAAERVAAGASTIPDRSTAGSASSSAASSGSASTGTTTQRKSISVADGGVSGGAVGSSVGPMSAGSAQAVADSSPTSSVASSAGWEKLNSVGAGDKAGRWRGQRRGWRRHLQRRQEQGRRRGHATVSWRSGRRDERLPRLGQHARLGQRGQQLGHERADAGRRDRQRALAERLRPGRSAQLELPARYVAQRRQRRPAGRQRPLDLRVEVAVAQRRAGDQRQHRRRPIDPRRGLIRIAGRLKQTLPLRQPDGVPGGAQLGGDLLGEPGVAVRVADDDVAHALPYRSS